MTAYTDFLADADQVRRWGNWVVDLEILDSSGNAVALPGEVAGALRVATHLEGFRTYATDSPAHAAWRPDLAPENGGGGGLRLESSLWSGGDAPIGGPSLPSEAELVIANPGGRYDPYLPAAGYRWEGQPCVARFGRGWGVPGHPSFMALSEFRAFRFELGGPRPALGQIRVPLYGLDRRFDQPLHQLVYRGTNYCLNFAAGGYAALGTPAKMDLTGAMTYEGWHYVENLTNNRFPMGWQAGTRTPWRIRVGSNGAIAFIYTHGSGTAATHASSAGLVVAGRWYHLTAKMTGTAGKFIVYDGLTGSEVVEPFTLASATRDTNVGGNLQISLNSASLSWVGPLDEQRVWNYERTDEEIRRDRHGELTAIPATCVGYYKHNDATGTTTTDSSASPAHGTLSGTTAWYHSLEGDDNLAGVPKGDAFGYTEFQSPVLVDPGRRIYHVGNGGALASIQPYDGLGAYTNGGDTASWKALQDASIIGGTFQTYLANGYVRIASPPAALKLTVTVEADANETKGEIIRDLVTSRGDDPLDDPGDLDTAAFTAIDAVDDSRHGLYVPAGQILTIREALDRLIGPGSFWGYEFDSQLFTLAQWTGPAETADLSIGPEHIIDIEPLGPALWAWYVELLFGRMELHGDSEIISSVKTTSASYLTYQRALAKDGWSRAPAIDQQILADHPRAKKLTYETQIQYPEPGVSVTSPLGRAAALQEARRIQDLLAGLEPYRFRLDPVGMQLSLGATIAPTAEIAGSPRISMDGTRHFSVLGISVDPATWNVDVIGVG